MVKILLPVDDIAVSNKTVADFIQWCDWYQQVPENHLLNVQLSLYDDIFIFIGKGYESAVSPCLQ